jgi:hypothetical protein
VVIEAGTNRSGDAMFMSTIRHLRKKDDGRKVMDWFKD